jgi:amidohydrolase
MSIEVLKKKVIEAVDKRAAEIIGIGDAIWSNPELGYKEFKAANLIESKYEEMGWKYENKLAVTGSKAYLKKEGEGPVVSILGEMDALGNPNHPDSDSVTGAIHACGHNAQVAAMLGAGFGLTDSGVLDELEGNIVLGAVPAEEYVDLEYRNALRNRGEIEFFGGKQEFIHIGAMNDIDISIGTHAASRDRSEHKMSVGAGSSVGFIGKLVRYIGKEAHAGAAPHKGINALNAAMLGLMGINALRETFREEDTIRVHPIITKGGDVVNNVPSDVRVESYVRGKTVDAIMDANKRVNTALRAGAMAIGAEVEINDLPGYMPKISPNPDLVDIVKLNCGAIVGENEVTVRTSHGTGSSDLGDVSCIMPTASFSMTGAEGTLHGRNYKVVDKTLQYVVPAKVAALICIDLLYDEAARAKPLISSFEPTIPRESYTKFMKKLVSG